MSPEKDPVQEAHIEIRTQIIQRCSACGSTAEHHVAYVIENGLCIV